MLLIFDLDDTLIPTSRTITPKRLEKALQKMIRSGLKVSYPEGIKLLLEINEGTYRSLETLEKFLLNLQGEKVHLNAGLSAFDEGLEGIEIEKDEEISQMLKEFCHRYPLAIVTAGNPKVQQEKIDRFGIDRKLFAEIHVANPGEKGKIYMQLQEKFGRFCVVGDRIKDDLSDAKKIGGITVHIRQGRGRKEPQNHPDVDHEITAITELKGILKTYDNK